MNSASGRSRESEKEHDSHLLRPSFPTISETPALADFVMSLAMRARAW